MTRIEKFLYDKGRNDWLEKAAQLLDCKFGEGPNCNCVQRPYADKIRALKEKP